MAPVPVNLLRIETQSDNAPELLARLRSRLSLRGDLVTPASRERTREIFGQELTPQQVVERICQDVAQRGLEAVLEYTRRIDGVELTAQTVRVPIDELQEAHRQEVQALTGGECTFLAVVRRIRRRIERFQRAILHQDVRVPVEGGWLEHRYRPIRRVGICVPGGAAAYPSTLLMTAVPAQVAGVEEIAVLLPPTRFGAFHPQVLATCWELGLQEVYRLGGAQGVAALAYGTEGIPKVDKIVGPGNLFVTLAKKFVFGEVAIDSLAGPSEIVVVVDHSAPAQYTAMDLLAQAEHAPGASILISWQSEVLERTLEAVAEALDRLDRGQLARESLEAFGAAIRVRDPQEAAELVDWIAPEHLQLAVEDPKPLLERIRYAGAIFVGHQTPVAVGDYAAGPSHVLPTSGTARFASGLSANDFLRAGSVLCFQKEGLEELAPDIIQLATVEGLSAHRASVEIRLGKQTPTL
ncbi:MAG: histidinol dehydrogenase [Thermoguttaceae bacterium]|nr:histidinol dehydrogenase [Thermoguttaceae bacterium]MDW8037487.1 histidinol dehydrogenase [Thermoguttaceae bacterium]